MKLANFITRIIDCFYIRPLRAIIPAQTFRYAACGGVALILSWALYAITYNYILDKQVVQIGTVVISAHIATFLLNFPITFFTGFWLQKYVTFTYSPLRGRTQLMRYFLSVAGSIILNYLGLKLFVDLLGVYPTPSQMLTSLLTIGYSYFMQKYFTFRGCTQ